MTKRRCVLYARVSTPDQEDNTSLEAQITRTGEHAAKRGYEVVEAIREVHSGGDPDRPGLLQIFELARQHAIDVVIFWTFDRFMRDERHAVIVEYELEKHGVTLEFCDLPEADAASYRILKTFYRWSADEEKRRIVKRLTDGKRARVQNGGVLVFGKAPLGYTIVQLADGRYTLEVNETEAGIVRDIFQWYTVGDKDSGPLSLGGIHKRLVERNIPCFGELRGDKGKWNRTYVGLLITNETYCGRWYYSKTGREENIAVEVPAIVSRETWDAAQRRKEQNTRTAKRNLQHEDRYLLRGMLKCKHCGYALRGQYMLTGNRKNKMFYYRCDARGWGAECDVHNAWRAEDVDAAAWGWLVEKFKDADAWRKAIQEEQEERARQLLPRQQELEGVQELIVKNRRELEKLLDLYLAGDFPKDMLNERKERIERLLDGLRNRQAHLEHLIAEQTLSAERVEFLTSFGDDVALGIEAAEHDFAKRRELVEGLELQGTLDITPEGDRVLEFTCIAGSATLDVEKHTIATGSNLAHYRSASQRRVSYQQNARPSPA